MDRAKGNEDQQQWSWRIATKGGNDIIKGNCHQHKNKQEDSYYQAITWHFQRDGLGTDH
jgi:hypothetical protein